MKTITIELSEKSIQAAIAEIEEYKQSLERKCDIFVNKMAKIGIEVIRATMSSVPQEDSGSWYVEEEYSENAVTIRLSGDKVLFVEFGAGVIYSNPQHPKAGEFGMGVGTYNPDSGLAWNMTRWGGGWWYTDRANGGESVHSFGNPVYMPVYKAGIEVINQAVDVAREVFGD